MRKILMILITAIVITGPSRAQTIFDSTGARSYINSQIVTNASRQITAAMLNRIFNGYLNIWPKYSVDSFRTSNDTVYYRKNRQWRRGFIIPQTPGIDAVLQAGNTLTASRSIDVGGFGNAFGITNSFSTTLQTIDFGGQSTYLMNPTSFNLQTQNTSTNAYGSVNLGLNKSSLIAFDGSTLLDSVTVIPGRIMLMADTIQLRIKPGIAGTADSALVRDPVTGIMAMQEIGGGGAGDALTTNPLSQFAATTSAQLRSVISDESGTGAFLTANGSAASLTSFPSTLGLVANRIDQNNAATTSAQLASVISDESGSGALIFGTSPSFTTPTIGAATATTINGFAIQNAAADGSTKGLSSFTAADFDASSGNIAIDYANGQKASGSVSGFVSTTTQTIAGAKTFTSTALVQGSSGSASLGWRGENDAGHTCQFGIAGTSYSPGNNLADYALFGTSTSLGMVYYTDGGVGSGGTSSMQWRVGGYQPNQERMRLTTTGLGIANGAAATPASMLDVQGSFGAGYVAKTTTYSLTASDFLVNCTSGSFTVTLPTAVSIDRRMYVIRNTGAGTITMATTSSQTIDGAAPGTIAAGGTLRVMSTGANWITW